MVRGETGAGAKVCGYEGAWAVGGTGSGSDWLKWTMYVFVCVYTYICPDDKKGVRRSSERRDGVRLCDMVNAGIGFYSTGKRESGREVQGIS